MVYFYQLNIDVIQCIYDKFEYQDKLLFLKSIYVEKRFDFVIRRFKEKPFLLTLRPIHGHVSYLTCPYVKMYCGNTEDSQCLFENLWVYVTIEQLSEFLQIPLLYDLKILCLTGVDYTTLIKDFVSQLKGNVRSIEYYKILHYNKERNSFSNISEVHKLLISLYCIKLTDLNPDLDCGALKVIDGSHFLYENKSVSHTENYRFKPASFDNDPFSSMKYNITQYSNLRDMKFSLDQFIKVQKLLQIAKNIQTLVIYDRSISRNISDLVQQFENFPNLTIFNTNHHFNLDSLNNTNIKYCLLGSKRNLSHSRQYQPIKVDWQTSCPLKSLCISALGVTDNSVVHFPDSLEELNISHCFVSNDYIAGLALPPNLKAFHIEMKRLERLPYLPLKLEELYILNCSLKSLPNLSKHKRLHTLVMEMFPESHANLDLQLPQNLSSYCGSYCFEWNSHACNVKKWEKFCTNCSELKSLSLSCSNISKWMDFTLLRHTRRLNMFLPSDIKQVFPRISSSVSELYITGANHLQDFFKNLQYGNFLIIQIRGSWNISKKSPLYLPSCVEFVRTNSFKRTEIYLRFANRGFTKLKYLNLVGNSCYSYESISSKVDGCFHEELEMISSKYPPKLDFKDHGSDINLSSMLCLLFEDALTPKNLTRVTIRNKMYLNPELLDKRHMDVMRNAQGSKRVWS